MSRVIHLVLREDLERTVCGLTTARPRDIAGQLTGLAPPCTLYEPDVTCTHCLTPDLGGPIRRDPDQAWEALARLARRRRVRLTSQASYGFFHVVLPRSGCKPSLSYGVVSGRGAIPCYALALARFTMPSTVVLLIWNSRAIHR